MSSNQTDPLNISNPGEFAIRQLSESVPGQINPDLEIINKYIQQDDRVQRQPLINLAKQHLKLKPKITSQKESGKET